MPNILQLNTRQAFVSSLHQLLDLHGFPASKRGRLQAFVGLTNRPSSTAQRWLTGKSLPDIEDLFLLCGIFGCSMDTLLGRTPIKWEYRDNELPINATYFSENGNADITIPSAFLPGERLDRPLGILRVSGTEMSGYAEPNDRVFFDMSDTEIRSGSVYVLRIAGQLVIRRLRVRIDKMIDVLCENLRYPAELVDPIRLQQPGMAGDDDVAVLGRIIAKLNFDHF